MPLTDRLTPAWLSDAAFGGIRGSAEVVILLVLVAWVIAGLLTNRRQLRATIDLPLAAVAVLLLLGGILGPEKYVNTIYFSSRWVAAGLTLLVLSVPAPRLGEAADSAPGRHPTRDVLLTAFAMAVPAAFSMAVAASWARYERIENRGLTESLAVIPEGASVLGLDLVKESSVLKGRPFLQTFAYAQVFHGGRLNFSFTSHYSGIVADAETLRPTWMLGLEWYSEQVRPRDLAAFEIVLVNGKDDQHALLQSSGLVQPLTTGGRWRAYRSTQHSSFGARR